MSFLEQKELLPFNPIHKDLHQDHDFYNSLEYDPDAFIVTHALHDTITPPDDLLEGTKGANLRRMVKFDLPIPPGFILLSSGCQELQDNNDVLPDTFQTELVRQLKHLETVTHTMLGDSNAPLFVAARSGAKYSMPGLMPTITHLGLNDQTQHYLTQIIGEKNTAIAYFHLVQNLGTHAYNLQPGIFQALAKNQLIHHRKNDLKDLPIEVLETLISQAKGVFTENSMEFPQDPIEQIQTAIEAVYGSWFTPAITHYREKHNIPNIGTAVTIQQMVHGNALPHFGFSGTGVLFIRDYMKGIPEPYLTFAQTATGSTVVGDESTLPYQALSEIRQLPHSLRKNLQSVATRIGFEFGPDNQEVEFTIQENTLYLLQARKVRGSSLATFLEKMRLLYRGYPENIARKNLTIAQLDSLLQPPPDPEDLSQARKNGRLITKGNVLYPGCESGVCIDSIQKAQEIKEGVILITELSNLASKNLPHNIRGIVTPLGSPGSHGGRHAVDVGLDRNIPIISAISRHRIETLIGNVITLHALEANGEVFLGEITRSESANYAYANENQLTPPQKTLALSWKRKLIQNPWELITSPEEQTFNHLREIRRAVSSYGARSIKEKETLVTAVLLPPEILMSYELVPAQNSTVIRDKLLDACTDDTEATIRTAFTDGMEGKSPWKRLYKPASIEEFFTDGTYENWSQMPGLSSMIVGTVPKHKLSRLPHIRREHCAWILTCSPIGNAAKIQLEISPKSPHLRNFEKITNTKMTISFTSDTATSSKIIDIRENIGSAWHNEPNIIKQARLTKQLILNDWWNTYHLAASLHAASRYFRKPCVLEGQSRFNWQKQELSWCMAVNIRST